jgi:hypothetical protein
MVWSDLIGFGGLLRANVHVCKCLDVSFLMRQSDTCIRIVSPWCSQFRRRGSIFQK